MHFFYLESQETFFLQYYRNKTFLPYFCRIRSPIENTSLNFIKWKEYSQIGILNHTWNTFLLLICALFICAGFLSCISLPVVIQTGQEKEFMLFIFVAIKIHALMFFFLIFLLHLLNLKKVVPAFKLKIALLHLKLFAV